MRVEAKLALALALVALELVVAEAVLGELGARTAFVSALLSPGAHSQLSALVLGAGFLVVRLSALVLLPPVLAGCLGFLVASATRRRFFGAAASPSTEAGPMLSRPRGRREGRGDR